MLPATIAIFRKLCSLQAKQKRCSDLNKRHPQKVRIEFFNLKKQSKAKPPQYTRMFEYIALRGSR